MTSCRKGVGEETERYYPKYLLRKRREPIVCSLLCNCTETLLTPEVPYKEFYINCDLKNTGFEKPTSQSHYVVWKT
jgi:hypothetical protein